MKDNGGIKMYTYANAKGMLVIKDLFEEHQILSEKGEIIIVERDGIFEISTKSRKGRIRSYKLVDGKFKWVRKKSLLKNTNKRIEKYEK